MATCKFCHREFANVQAVRAHLKSCRDYLDRRAARQAAEEGGVRHVPREPRDDGGPGSGSLRQFRLRQGGPTPTSPDNLLDLATAGSDPVQQLDEEIAMAKRRINLRQLQDTENDLDRRAKAEEEELERRAETANKADEEKRAARQREIEERKAREARDREKARRKQRHRDNVTAAKRAAIDNWPGGVFVSSALKAEILEEIERRLSALPADEMPLDELTRIAIGIRDRLCDQAERVEEEARRRERDKQQRELQQEQQHAARRQTLIQHGMAYARREIEGVEGLDYFGKQRIERRVQGELDEVTGDENRAEIEDWVEDILDREGIGFDDDDDEDDDD